MIQALYNCRKQFLSQKSYRGIQSQKETQQRREVENTHAKEIVKARGLSLRTTSHATTPPAWQKRFSVTSTCFLVFPANLSLGLTFGEVLT